VLCAIFKEKAFDAFAVVGALASRSTGCGTSEQDSRAAFTSQPYRSGLCTAGNQ